MEATGEGVCVYVCVCVCACVRACVRVCVCVRARALTRNRAHVYALGHLKYFG